jgi:hypothetical protein
MVSKTWGSMTMVVFTEHALQVLLYGGRLDIDDAPDVVVDHPVRPAFL